MGNNQFSSNYSRWPRQSYFLPESLRSDIEQAFTNSKGKQSSSAFCRISASTGNLIENDLNYSFADLCSQGFNLFIISDFDLSKSVDFLSNIIKLAAIEQIKTNLEADLLVFCPNGKIILINYTSSILNNGKDKLINFKKFILHWAESLNIKFWEDFIFLIMFDPNIDKNVGKFHNIRQCRNNGELQACIKQEYDNPKEIQIDFKLIESLTWLRSHSIF